MSTWSGVSAKLKGLLVAGSVLVAGVVVASIAPFLSFEETAEAGEAESLRQRRVEEAKAVRERIQEEHARWDREWEAKRQQWERERQARRAEAEAEAARVKAQPKQARRVRRWQWESPVETRAKLWSIPEEESEEATVTGLLRICTSEQEGSEEDCIGIWQVLRNIRIRSCDRARFRRITECDEDGETMLSVMRRAQKFAMGAVKARNRRQRWISHMTPTCEPPPNYPNSEAIWDRRHKRHCEHTVKLARRLMKGQTKGSITGARIIAWGGRCEDPRGACDDPLACARGLARVPGLETHNAFWCRPGRHGCASDIDPICIEMGYRSLRRTPDHEATQPEEGS
jgi:hypothetical protein